MKAVDTEKQLVDVEITQRLFRVCAKNDMFLRLNVPPSMMSCSCSK